ncbi:MAG TPA: hypothetical protein VLD57_03345 [Blastocatellia bacterium]|nr:hypothetical protein [Blastocatellia bacterium]
MLLSTAMITGFNTDVPHEGRVYHVQTEDRGKENPVLESLVYVGGTIIAKKRTPYAERLSDGATEATIASLLKKQHQVIIAAIKAGRIEDLVRHSAKEFPVSPVIPDPPPQPVASSKPATVTPAPKAPVSTPVIRPSVPQTPASQRPDPGATTYPGSPQLPSRPVMSGGLNLDQVISDYIKRSSQQERLDLKVITPSIFTAGKSVGLKIQVLYRDKNEPDAIVTVKVIGTAFKPQVFVGRAGADGVASFNLNLPAFSAGTAAIVLEAQSSHGRGELKHLIRRA